MHLLLLIINLKKMNFTYPIIFKLTGYVIIFGFNVILFMIFMFTQNMLENNIYLFSFIIYTLALFIIHFILDEDFLFRFNKVINFVLVEILAIMFGSIYYIILI